MDQQTLGYSMKNIPIPSQTSYLKSLINKTEQFIKNIRWKAFFFENGAPNKKKKETFGFKTENTPPQNKGLMAFENDLYAMISALSSMKINQVSRRN